MKKFLAICLSLCLAAALFAVPVLAEGTAEPTGSGNSFFANGTPITISAEAPQDGQGATVPGLTTGTDAYISWVADGVTKYVGISADATVYGGSNGTEQAVSVPSTSITMTGGTVRDLIGGNLGANAKTPLATVTGDVVMRVAGDAKVSNYIAGGGYNNACVNGTVSITLDGVDFAGLDPYVNGGVWGHGNEGTRNIADGTMTTQAVVNRVEIVVTNSKNIPLLGVGGGGSTKVKSGSLTVTDSTVKSLYLGGINGETGSCEVTMSNSTITNLAATNRGFVGTAVVNVNGGSVANFYTGATPGCFGSDSGAVDGSGVTGSIAWNMDESVQVSNAVITPNITSNSGQYTAEVGNVTVNKQGDALPMTAAAFEPAKGAKVSEFTVPAGETLKLEGTSVTIPSGVALKNEGTVENSGAIQNQGSLENTGSGRLENIGENAAISGNKPTGDNADVTYQFISGPANYTLGTKKDAVFTLNGSTDQFVDFYIDGARLTKDTDYTVKEGSVIVTVKASVMEKLSTGSHTLKAVYTLGEATGAISVEKQQTQEPAAPSTPTPAPEKANPKTGVAA
jgi:hypothetical protein